MALKDDPWGPRHGPAGYRHITWSVSDNPGPKCGPPAVLFLHGRFDDFARTGTRAGAAPPPPSTTMALGEALAQSKRQITGRILELEVVVGLIVTGRTCPSGWYKLELPIRKFYPLLDVLSVQSRSIWTFSCWPDRVLKYKSESKSNNNKRPH